MIRQIACGFLHGHDPIIAERWYYRYHCKEVVRAFGPWLRRYETYKTLPPPPQAERFGVRGGFLTELRYANLEDYVEAEPYDRKWTPMPPLPAGTAEVEPCHILVPARPTGCGNEQVRRRHPLSRRGQLRINLSDHASYREVEGKHLNRRQQRLDELLSLRSP